MADVCNCADPAIICDGRGKWCRICLKSERYELTRPASPSDGELPFASWHDVQDAVHKAFDSAEGTPKAATLEYEFQRAGLVVLYHVDMPERMRGAAVQEGFAIVPKIPTDAMMVAALKVRSKNGSFKEMMAAMIEAAAPEVPR